MNHLTHDQLSAYVDGALPAAEHAAADAHLAGCEACRAELETLRAADALFGEVLTHDPGDAYFGTFAARVAERIGAGDAAHPAAATAAEAAGEALGTDVIEAPPQRAGAPWWDIGSWFTMPQRLAWVGGVAAVVVVAGVTIMMVRESGVPDLRKSQVLERGAQQESRASEPQAPPAATMQAPEADVDAGARTNEGAAPTVGATGSDDAARGATPSGVRQMRRTAGGEDVPVGGREIPDFARAPEPAPPAEAQPGEPITVRRPQRAEPLAATAQEKAGVAKDEAAAPAPATQEAKRAATNLGATGAAEGESLAERLKLGAVTGVCGTVVDAQGRPLARAQVVLGDRGVTATTGEDGRFCFDVGPGEYDLTVLAVGFTPLRERVTLGDPNAPARLVARTVDVLPAPEALPPPVPPSSLPSTTGFRDGLPSAPAAPAGLPEAVRPRWEEAGRLMSEARRERSATRYEAAAAVWREVVPRIPDEALRLDARGHLADALYAAWEIEPTGARAAAAAAALRGVIERAPDGARKDRARRMLARLQP